MPLAERLRRTQPAARRNRPADRREPPAPRARIPHSLPPQLRLVRFPRQMVLPPQLPFRPPPALQPRFPRRLPLPLRILFPATLPSLTVFLLDRFSGLTSC